MVLLRMSAIMHTLPSYHHSLLATTVPLPACVFWCFVATATILDTADIVGIDMASKKAGLEIVTLHFSPGCVGHYVT